MKDSNQLLTVVIPTYNRANHLDSQLAWAVKSIAGRWEDIELLVCDNASSDNTVEVCAKWKEQLGQRLKVFRNSENVGLVKNCFLSIERASGKFVWLVGDDDPISDDAVDIVSKIIKQYPELNLVHINHRCVSGLDGSTVIPKFYQVADDICAITEGAEKLSKLLETHNTGGLMFITANVMNRMSALSFMKNHPPEEELLLVYPMYLNAGLASTGSFYLISMCLIDCVYHTSSWLDELEYVLHVAVPKTLLKLKALGVSKKAIAHCLDFQLERKLSYRDILYKIRANPMYFKNREFAAWLNKLFIKNSLKLRLYF